MIRYRGAVAGAASLALILGAVTAADAAPTLAATRPAASARRGRTLSPPGSRLYPETGNGGYTSVHTDVHLVYDAATNRFLPGNNVALTDRATQCLTGFSLDFERTSAGHPAGPDLTVGSVTVNGSRPRSVRPADLPGRPARSGRSRPGAPTRRHRPIRSADRTTTRSRRPARRSCLAPGAADAWTAPSARPTSWSSRPAAPITDGAASPWSSTTPAGPASTTTGTGPPKVVPVQDGGFVTTEPVGSEDWMPLNDYPTAKPTYDFYDTVGGGQTAIANGELVRPRRNPAERQFPRRFGDLALDSVAPVASYLVEDSVGYYTPDQATGPDGITYYEAQDTSIPAKQQAEEPGDHGPAAGHHRLRGSSAARSLRLGRGRGRHPPGQLRRRDADDDHLRRRRDRDRDPLPREHAPVVGRPRHRGRLQHDLLQGGSGHTGRVPVRGPAGAGPAGVPAPRAARAAFQAKLEAIQPDLREKGAASGGWRRPTRRRGACSAAPHLRTPRRWPTSRCGRSSGPANFDPGAGAGSRISYGGGNIDEAQLEAAFGRSLRPRSAACQGPLGQFFTRVVRHHVPAPAAGAARPHITGPGLAGPRLLHQQLHALVSTSPARP